MIYSFQRALWIVKRLALINLTQRTSQRVKRPPGAQLMTCSRSLDRSVGRSLDHDRSFDRSLDRSIARSRARSIARTLALSIAHSLDRSLHRSLDRSIVPSIAPSNSFGGPNFELCMFCKIIWGFEFRIAGVHHFYLGRLRISNYFSKELRPNIFIVSRSIIP